MGRSPLILICSDPARWRGTWPPGLGMEAPAEPGVRAWIGSDSPRPGSPTCSPDPDSSPGHSFRKVTLTKPTFCHLCSDFIWGLAGFLCDVCNFMSHEKCLRRVNTPCASLAPRWVHIPVAHCFGPPRLCKRRFCSVCRKGLEVPALSCQVCELHVHVECVPFACSDCRRCHQDGHQDQDALLHHWREGNLAPGTRCEVCRRTCGSSDVLTGMCCGWCGVQVHSPCRGALPAKCQLGRLHSLLLPPTCVRLCAPSVPPRRGFRISQDTAQGDGQETERSGTAESSKDLPPPETGKQTLKVFDGTDAVGRGHFLAVTVPCSAGGDEVLGAALRAHYLPGDLQDFELRALPPKARGPGDHPGGGVGDRDSPQAWVLCARPQPQEELSVHPAWPRAGVTSVSVQVTPLTTSQAVVLETLRLLGLQVEGPESFQLVAVTMGSRHVKWMPLEDTEPVLTWLQNTRQASLWRAAQTRFYVSERRPQAQHVSLFVGGLPSGLTPQEYRKLLDEALAIKAELVSLSHVYPAHGAVVLEVTCFTEAERLCTLARDTAVQGRPLTTLLLPEILHWKLPPDCRPLLVFVNPKSGGLQGADLLCSFRKLLNPHQVFQLTSGGPLPGLHLFSQVPCFRVLVCGGDGTVGWVLSALEELRPQRACPDPCVAVLPLGTGNDLGRVLRWGSGYSGEDPLTLLLAVDEADAVLLDRWTILLDAQSNGAEDVEPPRLVQMSNYCGIGIDAELSLDFHQAREEEPSRFSSRLHNKGVYVRAGLQKMSRPRALHRELRLQVGRQEVALPSLEGLIFINIPSWGSGADLWGPDSDSRFEKPRMDDGLLEVVGVTGVMHMGQVQGRLRSGIRIAQGCYFRVTLLKPTPVQVDGEPWVQAPGHMIIAAAGPKVHMLQKARQKPRKATAPGDRIADGVPAPGQGGP